MHQAVESNFSRALRELEAVHYPSRISFIGNIYGPGGREPNESELDVVKWAITPIISSTEEIYLRDSKKFRISAPKVSPDTAIIFGGKPNACTLISRTTRHAGIMVYLGLPFAFCALPKTVELIEEVTHRPSTEISDLEKFKPPRGVLKEIDLLMESWDESAKSLWTSSRLPKGATLPEPHSLVQMLIFAVTGHEIAHWMETIFKEDEWQRLFDEAKRPLLRLVSTGGGGDNTGHVAISPRVLENWTSEVQADCLAYHYVHSILTYGGWLKGEKSRQELAYTNVAMGIYFAFQDLIELYFKLRGQHVETTTHPPAAIRRMAFFEIEAQRNAMSIPEFATMQFGGGFAASLIMERILTTYAAHRKIRPIK